MKLLPRFISLVAVSVIAAFTVVDVSGVAVAASPTWSVPVDVSVAGGNAYNPQIVASSSGTLNAIWYRSDGTYWIVQSSASTDAGLTWSTPVNVSATGGNASNPQIVVNSSGVLNAIWNRHDGANNIVQSSASTDAGLTWSTPVNVSATGGNANNPQIVASASGALNAIWRRHDGTNYIVQSSASTDAGLTWSTPVDLSATGGTPYDPQIVASSSGALNAIWYSYDGTNWIVQSSASTDAGLTWSTPVNVSATGGDASSPQIVVSSSGVLNAIWQRNDGTRDIVQSSASVDAGLTWSAPVNLSTAGNSASTPQIVASSSGALNAIWYRWGGTNWIVQSSASVDDGATWSTPVDVSATGGDASSPQIVVNSSGALNAIWQRNYIVQSSASTDAGATWSTPVDLSAAGATANSPQIVVNSSGALNAIWQRNDGTNNIVQTSTLSAPPGAPTAVTATADNTQATITWTAPTADGGSAVTGYTVTSAPGGFTALSAGAGTTATVTGLTNGTSYTFTVTATNAAGTSVASAPSTAVTPPVTPPVITPAVLAYSGSNVASVATGIFTVTGLTLLGTVFLLASRRRTARS